MRTDRGRNVKAMKRLDSIEHEKGTLNLSGLCTSCNVEPECSASVKCCKCKSYFHIFCLIKPLTADFNEMMIKDPCIWWFCPNCIVTYESGTDDSTADIDATTQRGQVNFSNMLSESITSMNTLLSEQLTSLKSELMETVNKVIDDKLGAGKETLAKIDDTLANIVSNPEQINVSSSNITWASKVSNRPSSASIMNSNRSITSHARSSIGPDPSETPELLVLSPANNGCKSEPITEVKKSVLNKLKNIQYEFVKADKDSGKISLGFLSKNVREEVDELLNENEHLASLGYKSRSTDKLLPKIMITGVENSILDELFDDNENLIDTTDFSKEDIRELEKKKIVKLILAKNPAISDRVKENHTFQVVYVKADKSGRQNLTIGFKVSPAIRTALFTSERRSIYLESGSYQVSDRFYVKQCYHCQLFGHTSNQCPHKDDESVCLYCMGTHTSKKCLTKKVTSSYRCTNCANSKDPKDKANHTTHTSNSLDCPVLIKEHQRIAKITDFNSKNVR